MLPWKAGAEMASGMSGGEGGGFGTGSRSSSSAELSEWQLREAEGSGTVTGTLKHSDNFTRYDELHSWDPTNFLMLQNGGSTDTTRYRSRARDLFLSSGGTPSR